MKQPTMIDYILVWLLFGAMTIAFIQSLVKNQWVIVAGVVLMVVYVVGMGYVYIERTPRKPKRKRKAKRGIPVPDDDDTQPSKLDFLINDYHETVEEWRQRQIAKAEEDYWRAIRDLQEHHQRSIEQFYTDAARRHR